LQQQADGNSGSLSGHTRRGLQIGEARHSYPIIADRACQLASVLWRWQRHARRRIHVEKHIHIPCASSDHINTTPGVFQNPLLLPLSTASSTPHFPSLHLFCTSTCSSHTPAHTYTHLHRPSAQRALTRIQVHVDSTSHNTTHRQPNSKTTDLRSSQPTSPPKQRKILPAERLSERANHLATQHTHAQRAPRPTDPGDDAPGLRKADAAERRWLARHEIMVCVCVACAVVVA
jgi:hypothetical protein